MEQSTHNKKTKTKIVCTLGPSTNSLSQVKALIENGMSVARLNLSHGTIDDHKKSASLVRTASKNLNQPVGVMVDIPGKKYRTGSSIPEVINIGLNSKIRLTSADITGSPEILSIKPAGIH